MPREADWFRWEIVYYILGKMKSPFPNLFPENGKEKPRRGPPPLLPKNSQILLESREDIGYNNLEFCRSGGRVPGNISRQAVQNAALVQKLPIAVFPDMPYNDFGAFRRKVHREELIALKNLSLLVWLTQLGFSVAFPLAGFVLLAVWLRSRFGLGVWVIVAGVVVGLICAVDGLRMSLKAMNRLAKDKPGKEPPPVSFNDHD